MSNSNETLKKCCRCKIVKLIENFNKDKNRKDGLCPQGIDCRKKLYLKNLDQIKIYNEQNRERTNRYLKNKRETDVNFRLISNTRSRIYKSLRGLTKQLSSRNILGIDIDLYRKWIEWQMTPDMTWDNVEIDHVRPISSFDISDDEQLKEAFNWRNTQPFLKEIRQKKNIKYNFLDYRLQFIKSYQFLKINEEGLN